MSITAGISDEAVMRSGTASVLDDAAGQHVPKSRLSGLLIVTVRFLTASDPRILTEDYREAAGLSGFVLSAEDGDPQYPWMIRSSVMEG